MPSIDSTPEGRLVEASSMMSRGLGEAILLRTIMKNNPRIRERVLSTLRREIAAVGIRIDEAAWGHLVLANASELENSKAHVIE